jgi:hypothetical protein
MQIDWNIVSRIAAPLIALAAGIIINRLLEDRPRLVTFYGHTSSHIIQGQTPTQVHTHSVIVRNAGRKPAHNVRLGHNMLENFAVPQRGVRSKCSPRGGAELQFRVLIPKEQVTISYLYLPPVLYSQINTYVKCDEGYARLLEMLPTPRPPRWLIRLNYSLIGLGILTLLYLLWRGLRFLAH